MSTNLLQLAERCEKAEGPDFALENDISHALGRLAGNVTASIDAATQLVPEGAGMRLDRYWIASVERPVWSCHIQTGGVPDNPRQVFEVFDAATPALALVSAALKARAAQESEHAE